MNGPSDFTFDFGRADRLGFPETVFGEGKTPSQVVAALATLAEANPGRAVLATRCGTATREAVREAMPEARIDDPSGTITLGPLPMPVGSAALVTAGTSDISVAREAAATLAVHAVRPIPFVDVGVAGIHRLLAVVEAIRECDVAIAIAGMEGALPTVLAGLVDMPVIGVPTSVGYGVAADGRAALDAMLASCGPGLTVVNIDNGYGAAVAAARIVARLAAARGADRPAAHRAR